MVKSIISSILLYTILTVSYGVKSCQKLSPALQATALVAGACVADTFIAEDECDSFLANHGVKVAAASYLVGRYGPLLSDTLKKACETFRNHGSRSYAYQRLRCINEDQHEHCARLEEAVKSNNPCCIEYLVQEKGDDPNKISLNGQNLLLYAIEHCTPQTVEKLLTNGASCRLQSGPRGLLPLSFSLIQAEKNKSKKSKEISLLLIQHTSNVDPANQKVQYYLPGSRTLEEKSMNYDEETTFFPLKWVINENLSPWYIEFLLNAGLDPFDIDGKGKSALHCVIYTHDYKCTYECGHLTLMRTLLAWDKKMRKPRYDQLRKCLQDANISDDLVKTVWSFDLYTQRRLIDVKNEKDKNIRETIDALIGHAHRNGYRYGEEKKVKWETFGKLLYEFEDDFEYVELPYAS